MRTRIPSSRGSSSVREITQIRLAGFGGQGIVLAGMLLGIAGVREGLEVANSNSYGAQARGSACKAEVVLGRKPIVFPHVLKSDILITLSQEAYELFLPDMAEDGTILFDPYHVHPGQTSHTLYEIPATQAVLNAFKSPQAANIVMLGAFTDLTGIISRESMTGAVKENVPQRFVDVNLKALELGFELAKQAKGAR